jgi:hypothetical protein
MEIIVLDRTKGLVDNIRARHIKKSRNNKEEPRQENAEQTASVRDYIDKLE